MYKSSNYAGLAGPAFFWARTVAVVVALFVYGYGNANAQALRLPLVQLSIGPHQLQAEVAATESSRNYGLMNRESLPSDHGMLFVFDSVGRPCFWMKNTPLPLTIAFIDRHGIIVNLADMQPYSEATHCPVAPVLYALEMEQGWFQSKGIQPGQQIVNLPERRMP